MKLSVIIPVYNSSKTLQHCVDSIIAQQCPDLEIILVDDGSTDHSLKICYKLARNNPQIKVATGTHAGLAEARNKGISMASGDYVTFVDSDDDIYPGTYAPLLKILSEQPDIDILEYPIHKGYPNKSQNTWKAFCNKRFSNPSEYWIATQGYRHCFACNKVFRLELLTANPFHTLKTFEDVELMSRLIALDINIATTDQGLYHYYTSPNSITQKAQADDLETLFNMNRPIYDRLPSSDYQHYLINIATDIFLLTGKRLKNGRKPYYNSIKQIISNTLGINILYTLMKLIKR